MTISKAKTKKSTGSTVPGLKTKRKLSSRVKKIVVKPLMSDAVCGKMEGNFIDADYYKTILGNENVDVYCIDDSGKEVLLLKLRCGVISQDDCKSAFGALKAQASKWNSNRGAAAGKINLNSLPTHITKDNIIRRDSYRVHYKTASGKNSKDSIGNRVRSNIIGYFDMPDRNLIGKGIKNPPQCRQTQFTRDNVEKWKLALPVINAANDQFRKLVPDRWHIQHKQASKTPEYQINKTAYSTVTINYNYRSAAHKDAGDLEEGFGNLIVLEKDKCEPGPNVYSYTGGYLGFPRYGIAVDVRQGDYLAMNVHEWHANTKIICGCPAGKKCKNNEHHGRLSLVCYLRKNMITCATNH